MQTSNDVKLPLRGVLSKQEEDVMVEEEEEEVMEVCPPPGEREDVRNNLWIWCVYSRDLTIVTTSIIGDVLYALTRALSNCHKT